MLVLGSSKSLTTETHGACDLGPQVATAAEKESQDTKATVDKVQAHVHHDPSNLNLGLGSESAGICCCAPKMKGLKTCQRCKIQMKVHQFGVGISRAEVKKVVSSYVSMFTFPFASNSYPIQPFPSGFLFQPEGSGTAIYELHRKASECQNDPGCSSYQC